jgi:hypothetical protein
MEKGYEKYNKVLNLLIKSKPQLNSTEDIEREVMRQIKQINNSGSGLMDILDFLFSWVYIGWVRRSLIAASLMLVLIFVYQQGVILKRIDVLSKQTIVSEREVSPAPADEIEKLLMVYKNSGRRLLNKNITISESQMRELLESVKDMQLKYKDLENIIESDSVLKSLIEKKLKQNERLKTNL